MLVSEYSLEMFCSAKKKGNKNDWTGADLQQYMQRDQDRQKRKSGGKTFILTGDWV